MIEPLGIFGKNFFDCRRAQITAFDEALGELVLTEGDAVGKVGGGDDEVVIEGGIGVPLSCARFISVGLDAHKRSLQSITQAALCVAKQVSSGNSTGIGRSR